jgi:hypothetical protein
LRGVFDPSRWSSSERQRLALIKLASFEMALNASEFAFGQRRCIAVKPAQFGR